MSNILRVVWFSKDRAFQLQQAISSFTECAQLTATIHVHHVVLYKTTSDKHSKSYIELSERLSSLISIEFTLETSFSSQLCSFIESAKQLNITHMLFAVDDLFFFSEFSINNILDALNDNESILTFVLPLHTHLTRSQTTNKPINSLPQFSVLKKECIELTNPIFHFLRSESENEYLYPFHLSGAIYRTSDLYDIVNEMCAEEPSRKCFSNPNLFEMNVCNWISKEERKKKQIQMELMNELAAMNPSSLHKLLQKKEIEIPPKSQQLTSIRPRSACFSNPISAVITINRVQDTFKTLVCKPISSSSIQVAVAPDDLLAFLDEGAKLDISAYKEASATFNAMHIGNFYLKQAEPK